MIKGPQPGSPLVMATAPRPLVLTDLMKETRCGCPAGDRRGREGKGLPALRVGEEQRDLRDTSNPAVVTVQQPAGFPVTAAAARSANTTQSCACAFQFGGIGEEGAESERPTSWVTWEGSLRAGLSSVHSERWTESLRSLKCPLALRPLETGFERQS